MQIMMEMIALVDPQCNQTSITDQLFRAIEFKLSIDRQYLFNGQVADNCSKAPKAN